MFTAPFLTPGTYEFEVTVQGFKKWVRDGIILQVNQRARASALLRTDSSEVGTVIEERAIKELPLNGRNFATLVYPTPGITRGQSGENLSGAGGWQLAGIGTITTGRPFTVFMQNGVNNGAPSWPNRIGSGILDNPTVDQWYNPRDFAAPPANTYGNSGRGILHAPGHVNFDTSLSKRFAVAGRSNVEFRWDAFNLFNRPGFGFSNQNFDSPTAGRITTTSVDNRSMPFSLKFNF